MQSMSSLGNSRARPEPSSPPPAQRRRAGDVTFVPPSAFEEDDEDDVVEIAAPAPATAVAAPAPAPADPIRALATGVAASHRDRFVAQYAPFASGDEDAQVWYERVPIAPDIDRFSDIRPYAHNALDDGGARASPIAVRGSPARYYAVQAPRTSNLAAFIEFAGSVRASRIINLLTDGETVQGVRLSDDGSLVGRYWDARSGDPVYPPRVPRGGAPRVELGADGRTPIAVATNGHRTPISRYADWPDMRAPGPGGIERVARILIDLTPEPSGPIVLHCRAGVGRTGTLIAAHAMYAAAVRIHRREASGPARPARVADVPAHRSPPCGACGSERRVACLACGAPFDVARVVAELRAQRPSMVQTEEQMLFALEAATRAVRMELGWR